MAIRHRTADITWDIVVARTAPKIPALRPYTIKMSSPVLMITQIRSTTRTIAVCPALRRMALHRL